MQTQYPKPPFPVQKTTDAWDHQPDETTPGSWRDLISRHRPTPLERRTPQSQ
jgi:hypothetical protein